MSFADLINIENCIFESNCFSKKSFLVFNKNFKHCTENQILFFQTSWKDGLSKKIVMKYDLSCIIGKNDISFFQKYDLTLRRKMKDDLSQKKNTRKYDIFFKCSEKMVFSKEIITLGYDLYCIIWKDGIFSRKHDISSLEGKWEASFSKKYMEIWNFLCTRTGVTNVAPCPSVKKNQTWFYTAKIHLKVIDVLDWHSRKNSSNSHFSYIDLQKKNQET